MSSLSPKDRVSLCLFSFTDGRRCRTPRTGNHPHFCFYHAQKEARVQAAEKISQELAYFFSGDYISAGDLSTALSRLIPAVIRGDIKPRVARTVAYMFQTQLQAIHLSQREYINAYGTEGWRKALRGSVTSNYRYLFPPDPNDAETPAPPAPPSTSVGAGPARPDRPSQPPSRPQHSPSAAPQPPTAAQPSPAQVAAALAAARSLFPRRPNPLPPTAPPPPPMPAATTATSSTANSGNLGGQT